jgi:hypothetical protein
MIYQREIQLQTTGHRQMRGSKFFILSATLNRDTEQSLSQSWETADEVK